ncbi:MAG: tetratricopeptide repeat-containing glycosyltransferase family protein [Nevskia sp.]|nr:tetratricopeptide repeat-containing glycosyltransferase family protein [Nevskia sp.]
MSEQAEQAFQIGAQFERAGNAEQARAYYAAALAYDGRHAPAHTNLASLLIRAGKLEAALAHLSIAASALPGNGMIQSNLGGVLLLLGRYEEARPLLAKARQLAPDFRGSWHVSGMLHAALGMNVEALRCYDRALKLGPGDPIVEGDRGRLLLSIGDLPAGFAAWEARWRRAGEKHPVWQSGIPRWQGEDLQGKRVFVHFEQGLGDTLQFCRFVPQLLQRGARVVLSVQPPLISLLQMSLPGIEVTGPVAAVKADFHCPLLSLPLHLGVRLQDIKPFPLTFERGPRQVADDGRLKVGIVWAGSPAFDLDTHRSMELRQMLPLADSEIALYSLQVGPRAADIEALGVSALVHDLAPMMTDFMASARLIDQLDLVVCVDTATLHLAAGIGKPAIALLPFSRCWRWLRNRDDSPWYPTLRIVQQKTPGDWAGAVARARKLLSMPQLQARRAAS